MWGRDNCLLLTLAKPGRLEKNARKSPVAKQNRDPQKDFHPMCRL